MSHIAKGDDEATVKARGYRSELRAQHALETRTRILDATVRVMARGIATLSIPDVAAEAGVSIPTVYRHFKSKRDLLEAVYPHVAQRTGLERIVPPTTVAEFRKLVRNLFTHLGSADDLDRAAMASPVADEVRRITMPNRVAMSRRFVDAVAPAATETDRARISRLMLVLTTSSAIRVWRDHLGSSADQAVDDVDWVLRAALAAAEKENRP